MTCEGVRRQGPGLVPVPRLRLGQARFADPNGGVRRRQAGRMLALRWKRLPGSYCAFLLASVRTWRRRSCGAPGRLRQAHDEDAVLGRAPAAERYLSVNTIRTQAGSIYRKLGAASRSQAVARARELGLLEAEDGFDPIRAMPPACPRIGWHRWQAEGTWG